LLSALEIKLLYNIYIYILAGAVILPHLKGESGAMGTYPPSHITSGGNTL
jgi:hypothetical protein